MYVESKKYFSKSFALELLENQEEMFYVSRESWTSHEQVTAWSLIDELMISLVLLDKLSGHAL